MISSKLSQTQPNTQPKEKKGSLEKTIKMQAASCFVQPFFPSKSAAKKLNPILGLDPPKAPYSSSRYSTIRAVEPAFEPLSCNDESLFSVFPAEACETIGGATCAADMFPEVKLHEPEGSTPSRKTSSEPDREYFDYDSEPSSVLRAEACEDLGGEFCEAPYN